MQKLHVEPPRSLMSYALARLWIERHVLTDPRRGGKTKRARCALHAAVFNCWRHTGAHIAEATMVAALIDLGFEVRQTSGTWGRGLYCTLDEQVVMDLATESHWTDRKFPARLASLGDPIPPDQAALFDPARWGRNAVH